MTHLRLYSAQPRFVYDLLLAGESYFPEPHKELDHWLNDEDAHARTAYDWLGAQMVKRGMPRPSKPHAHPVWAWLHWAGPARSKPDLRYRHLRAQATSERHVLLELDVPSEEVLLSDYTAWFHPLNGWLCAPELELEDFKARCKAAGTNPFKDRPLKDPALQAEVTLSWETIFDLDAARCVTEQSAQDQKVQATFWELKPEHVYKAREFGADAPAQWLPRPCGTHK